MLYRTESFEKTDAVMAEMRSICKFLYQWRKYKPIVAGGALWSWAANKHCRDADVFMRKRMFLENKILKYFATNKEIVNLSGLHTSHGGYGRSSHTEKKIPFDLYKVFLAQEKIAIDVILTGNRPIDTVRRNFDYEHCKVGFGKNQLVATGVDAYSQGKLKTDYSAENVRPEWVILNKIQPDLWGKDIATVKLLDVLNILSGM